MATKSNGKKAKQVTIPGTDRKVHADVREAAEEYIEVRDERMGLTTKETETKEALMAVMKKHKLTRYVDEDAEIEVEIVPIDETVKVRKWKAPKAEKADGDEAGASAE